MLIKVDCKTIIIPNNKHSVKIPLNIKRIEWQKIQTNKQLKLSNLHAAGIAPKNNKYKVLEINVEIENLYLKKKKIYIYIYDNSLR